MADDSPMTPKILVISWMTPHAFGGSAMVMANLAQQFSPAEMCFVGEGVPTRETRAGSFPPVEYLDWERHSGIGRLRRFEDLAMFIRVREPLRFLQRIIDREKVQAILAVYPRGEYLWLAYLAARRNHLPFYPYFHNTYLENMRGLQKWIARGVQKRVLADARHVFVISQGMEEYFRQTYPGVSVSPLVHTFQEPLPPFAPPPPPGERLRLAFCGSPSESCIDALSRMMEAARYNMDCEFDFYVPNPQNGFRRLGDLPAHWRLHDSAQTSREQLLRGLRAADVLMLPHGFQGSFAPVEYQTIFPTKTIDYLISGRPILAHTPPNCFLTRFLKRQGCALVVEEKSVSALAEALNRLRADGALRAQLVGAALKTAEMFQPDRVAGELRRIIAGTITSHGG